MRKRVKTEESPAPKSPSPSPPPSPSPEPCPPRKRSKRNTKVEEKERIVDVDPDPEQNLNAPSSDPENEEDDASEGDSDPVTRDPDYYFADGSVVVRVDEVLFKVHASVLGARSKIFKEMFDKPTEDGEPTRGDKSAVKQEEETVDDDQGTSDDHPITINRVASPQFRNLLKMIYCLPSDESVAVLESNASGERAWDRFELLADVADLSRQFEIPDLEKWATNRLKTLLENHTESIASHFGQLDDSFDWLIGVLRGTKTTAPRLAHDLRCLIQYSCHDPGSPVPLGNILCLFRTEALRGVDEALYGYAFLLLLNRGHKDWASDEFSQMDRMALFSAQSYLTPLPSSLYEGMKSPLFVKPDSVISFSDKVLPKVTNASCLDKCQKVAFRSWREEFNA